ncbi:hypothetical protein GFC29_3027 [Anoxybacillus sp. B7M1]|uniref:hypothetical protein n=1 Tax=unclassified Anoxybacillus TaxID=2639704 RepID=UPI0006973C7C|nr:MULTISPECIES: hypothetical protein [unclassified Anoxybacillus]ANB55910.1 hypothetical protein GFC28_2408 [Anoxybacillus sp. B2M1]ANB64195.1 hypothetical protein GFC29_3027 [Anoxybacillus sp. B7M1]OQM44165.1 hypothetical protein B6A27_18060 [Anoxybacillus sp. UARK-01]
MWDDEKESFTSFLFMADFISSLQLSQGEQTIKQTGGCEEVPAQAEETKEVNGALESADSPHSRLSLGQQFLPPHFLVKKFTVEAHDKSIKLTINYTVSESLYKALGQYNDYYFMI